MVILLKLFSIVSLFIFIIIIFPYFSNVIISAELIPYTDNFFTLKDFKDDKILYRNIDLEIDLNYFLNWNITYESPYEVEFSLVDKDNTTTTIDSFTPIFNIFVDTRSNDTASLAELVNQTISNYNDNYYYSNFTIINQNLNSSNTDWLKQQDQPYAMLNYSYIDSYDNIVVNNTEVITIYNDRVYSILFSADESKYKEHISDIKQMINSLKIFSLIPYENFDMGVRMTYPSYWNLTEETETSGVFFSELEDEFDPFYENLRIHEKNLPNGNNTLKDYLNYKINLYKKDTSVSNLVISDPKNTTLFDIPAYSFKYSFTDDNGYNKKSYEIGTIIGNKVYYIEYRAHHDSYSRYLPTVQKMIESSKKVEFLPYDNFDMGLRMTYPSDWKKQEDGKDVTFSLPSEKDDIYTGSMSLYSLDLPYASMNVSQALDYYVNMSLLPLNKIDLITKTTNLTLGKDKPAFGVNFTYYDTALGTKLNGMTIGTIVDNSIYRIIYFEDPLQFNTNLPTVQKMIESSKKVEFLHYDNFDMGLRMTYPSDWNVTEGTKTYTSFKSDLDKSDDLYAFLNIYNQNLPNGNNTLKDYLNYKINLYKKDTSVSNLVISDPKNTTLFDIPAYSFKYSFTDDNGYNKKSYEIGTIIGNKVYSINFQAQPDSYSKYLPTVQKIEKFSKRFELELYDNTTNQIQIKYPSSWNIYHTKGDITFDISDYLYPKDNLTIYSYNSTKDFNNVIKSKNNTYTDKNNLNYTYIGQRNYNITTTLGSLINVTQLSFKEFIQDKFNITITEIVAKYKDKVYSITFQTKEDRYNSDISPLNDIINNFRIIELSNNTKSVTKIFSQLISKIEYPEDWDFDMTGLQNIGIISPKHNIKDEYRDGLYITIRSMPDTDIEYLASTEINVLKGNENFTNFKLIESKETVLSNYSAHKIVYTFKEKNCECDYKVMMIIMLLDNKAYYIEYYAELEKFSSYFHIIENIINSIKFQERMVVDNENITGLRLNVSPIDLALNPTTNKIYVSIPETKQILVINGFTDQIIQNITIEVTPSFIVLNPTTNKIFVGSSENDMIYVIDGITNNIIKKIQAGSIVADMALDTNEFGGSSTLLFVANQGNDSVSIIDDVKGKVLSNIKTRTAPFGIGIDTIKNRAFITTDLGIDIIDYTTNLEKRNVSSVLYHNIFMDSIPLGIVVNSNTSKAYVTNFGENTISVIDTILNKQLYKIKVGPFPASIAYNPTNKILYVSNTGDNSISLINSSITQEDLINSTSVIEVPVDSISYDVAVNPKTDMVYLANAASQSISTLNSTLNKLVSALLFHIYPSDAGHIECVGREGEIPLNVYLRIVNGTHCKAIVNPGFVFASWSNKPPSSDFHGIPDNKTLTETFSVIIKSIFGISSNNHENSFNVSKYEIRTANFYSLASIVQVASPYLSVGTLLSIIFIAALRPSFHINGKIKEDDKKSKKDLQTIIPNLLPKVHKSESDKKEKRGQKDDDTRILNMGQVLTIDASLLIGVLIFLSFTEGFEESEQYQINVITASIVFPFAISAVLAVMNKDRIATRLMIAGFINLMISVILIAIMKL